MSLSYYEGLKPVKLPDPRIDIRTQNKYLFKQPANVVTYKTFNSNSTSQNSTHFTATPPNPNIIISPLVYVNLPATVKVTGKTAAANAPADFRDMFFSSNTSIVPRQLPISSIIQTLSLKLNTDTTTVNLNDYIHAIARFYSDDAIRAYEMSSSPVQPDFFQKYNDDINTTGAGKDKGLGYGTNRSPFQKYGANTNESTRSSYKPYKATYEEDGNDGIATVDYDFDEPLFISPLSSGEYSKMGLVQIQTFDLDITWDSKLNRILSCNKAGLDDKATANGAYSIRTILGDPKLRFIYMTPHINYPIPETVIYEFSELNRISKSVRNTPLLGWNPDPANAEDPTPGPNGESLTITSDNIQLSSIPNKVYIYVRRSNEERTEYTSDAFARITGINIDFNGVSGILASAKEHDLWRMTVNNGARI